MMSREPSKSPSSTGTQSTGVYYYTVQCSTVLLGGRREKEEERQHCHCRCPARVLVEIARLMLAQRRIRRRVTSSPRLSVGIYTLVAAASTTPPAAPKLFFMIGSVRRRWEEDREEGLTCFFALLRGCEKVWCAMRLLSRSGRRNVPETER